MILMALDHTRDLVGFVSPSPTDIAQTTIPLFFTRWITHLCAPIFFLLTGTGAYLLRQKRSPRELSRLLVTRGLWLIVLELTVLRFGYQFNVDYRVTMLLVMWALGWSMIALAALVYLPAPMVTAAGVVLIAGHDLFDSVRPSSFGAFAPLWSVLHVPSVLIGTPRFTVFAAYPLIPWVGVTAVGFGLGQIYSWPPERRRSFLLRSGVALIIAFVVLRWVNGYGDPFRWSAQRSGAFTILSFLNTNKYPPSLLYLLMTIGPALLLLWSLDGGAPRLLRPAVVIGRVPMFYYVLHFPLIHLAAVAVCSARYGAVHWMFESARLDQYPMARPPGWGLSLPAVYAIWIAVVIALFPACRWFAAVKQRRGDWWLTYL